MFGLGWQELIIILIIALIIFGPRKLPEIGKSIGQAINSFKESTKRVADEAKKELGEIEPSANDTSKSSGDQDSPPVGPSGKDRTKIQ